MGNRPTIKFSDLFEYQPGTGDLVWRVTRGKGLRGAVAGFANAQGYREIGIGGRNYKSHRIIWEMHNGKIPEGACIDHVDGNGLNNRLSNLRLATTSQNLGNRKRTAGRALPKGVVEVPGNKKNPYRATISADGGRHCLGYYRCPTAAQLAYMRAARELFGEFARVE